MISASPKSPYLRPAQFERSTAAFSATAFAHDDDDPRPCIDQFLNFEVVVVPSDPVAARGLDKPLRARRTRRQRRRTGACSCPRPYSRALVQQRPERMHALASAPSQLHVLLRHRQSSICRRWSGATEPPFAQTAGVAGRARRGWVIIRTYGQPPRRGPAVTVASEAAGAAVPVSAGGPDGRGHRVPDWRAVAGDRGHADK